jgi:hypothetical protein
VDHEWRAEDRPLPAASSDPLEAGRNRYDSSTWRRIYDSFAWKWVVGPIAYGAIVALAYAVIFDRSITAGVVFGAFMTLFVLARLILHQRQQNRAESG